ncbi:protein GAMETOPHYTE DEFECTIVE 1 [Cornus florida]|uniref:protein GAMETOPHYTE DEFECTIVE 1 n=1 Tax=Cornus florida TaxID=4283 RepID=UPI00289DE30F|nr:protein GAMETOPHYTE DEFECTIVE 1 [Cornus florida]
MGFFDLNIPYLESDKLITDKEKSTRKTTRLKLIVKAMELGYTGVAYNRTIKGVMSESDRCSISLFPLSSILKLAPSLSTSVKFHRDLLNVPISTPFRQYTRLTVNVDGPSQASSLNSGNPILKSYDIVAVRPLNQNAFEQACQASEVDLISIDFSEKLPFRLKQPMVKAAIGRGVYFEIMYSSLMMDAQVRRQMISNAKLLVDWTRGKNIIFSSAAPSVTELRGPYDVANLSLLLGLPMERAKAAISKNCRSLLANSLRKKQCYKEAIKVEVISSSERVDSEEHWSHDWLKWDPISSGEGDLLLDDMAKSFSTSNKTSKTVKPIDFASVVDSLPSHGLQVKDFISITKAASQPLDIRKHLSIAEEMGVAAAINGITKQPDRPNLFAKEDRTSLCNSQLKCQSSITEDSRMTFSPTDTLKNFTNTEEIVTDTTTTEEEPKSSNGLEAYLAPTGIGMHDLQSQSCKASCQTHVMLADHNMFQSLVKDTDISTVNAVAGAQIFNPSKDIECSAFQSEESERSNGVDAVMASPNVTLDEVSIETDVRSEDPFLSSQDMSSLEREQFRETIDDSISLADGLPVLEPYDGMKDEHNYKDSISLADGLPVLEPYDGMKDEHNYKAANNEQVGEVVMEEQKQTEDHVAINYATLDESVLGKGRVKQKMTHQPLLLPFNRVLHPRLFKKKPRNSNKKF